MRDIESFFKERETASKEGNVQIGSCSKNLMIITYRDTESFIILSGSATDQLVRNHWVKQHTLLESILEEVVENDGSAHVSGLNISEVFMSIVQG